MAVRRRRRERVDWSAVRHEYRFVVDGAPPRVVNEIANRLTPGFEPFQRVWEVVDDLDDAEIDEIARRIDLAYHGYLERAGKQNRAEAKSFLEQCAQDVAAKRRSPGRTTLVRMQLL